MRGLVSFHAVDPAVVDEVVHPLIAGGKIRPEGFLDEALRLRRNGWHASRYARGLARLLDDPEPMGPDPAGGLLDRVRTHLDRMRHEPDPRAVRVREAIEPELHLEGRPFLILDGAAERVTTLVGEYLAAPTEDAAEALALEQVAGLGAEVARGFEPGQGADVAPEFNYRRDVLDRLRVLFDLPRAARTGETWRAPGERPRPAREVLRDELAWHAARVHGLVRPFWVARDVDGLETVCRTAGVEGPGVLVPAWRLVAPALEEFPELRTALTLELTAGRSVGAYCPPEDVPALAAFLTASGAAIIRVATRHGEGPACATLLRKIRECVHWAESRGMGYLEAVGIAPPWQDGRFADPVQPD